VVKVFKVFGLAGGPVLWRGLIEVMVTIGYLGLKFF